MNDNAKMMTSVTQHLEAIGNAKTDAVSKKTVIAQMVMNALMAIVHPHPPPLSVKTNAVSLNKAAVKAVRAAFP